MKGKLPVPLLISGPEGRRRRDDEQTLVSAPLAFTNGLDRCSSAGPRWAVAADTGTWRHLPFPLPLPLHATLSPSSTNGRLS